MPAPASLPRWADVGGSITEPSSGKKDVGWVVAERPPAQYFNWLLNLIYQWLTYLSVYHTEARTWTALQTFSAGVTLSGGNLAMGGGDITGCDDIACDDITCDAISCGNLTQNSPGTQLATLGTVNCGTVTSTGSGSFAGDLEALGTGPLQGTITAESHITSNNGDISALNGDLDISDDGTIGGNLNVGGDIDGSSGEIHGATVKTTGAHILHGNCVHNRHVAACGLYQGFSLAGSGTLASAVGAAAWLPIDAPNGSRLKAASVYVNGDTVESLTAEVFKITNGSATSLGASDTTALTNTNQTLAPAVTSPETITAGTQYAIYVTGTGSGCALFGYSFTTDRTA